MAVGGLIIDRKNTNAEKQFFFGNGRTSLTRSLQTNKKLNQGDDKQKTDITTFGLNRPRGRFSENPLILDNG